MPPVPKDKLASAKLHSKVKYLRAWQQPHFGVGHGEGSRWEPKTNGNTLEATSDS